MVYVHFHCTLLLQTNHDWMNPSKSFRLGSSGGRGNRRPSPPPEALRLGGQGAPRGEGYGSCTSGALPGASTPPPGGPLTLARLVSRDALRAQSLVHDVEHLPAQVEDEQRQRPQRHCGQVERSRPGVLRRREGRRVVAKATAREAASGRGRAPPRHRDGVLGFPEARSRGRVLFPTGRAGLRENEGVGRGGVPEGQSAKKGEEPPIPNCRAERWSLPFASLELRNALPAGSTEGHLGRAINFRHTHDLVSCDNDF